MKKMIISTVMLAVAAGAYAQMEIAAPATTSATSAAAPQTAGQTSAPVTGENNQWLTDFLSVEVNAPFDIKFVQVPDTQAPRIIYDTKGSTTTKFKAEVKDKVLRISERPDSRRLERTTVTLEYNDVQSIKIENATATFSTPVVGVLFDLTVGGTADVTAEVDVKDLKMELTGKSNATLTGKARYLTLYASTGKCDAAGCEVMAAQVNSTTGAQVLLWVTDRLEAKTSTNGKISYKGEPAVIRSGAKFMGGDIIHMK